MLSFARTLSLVAATMATGLSAGLLYAYSCSVMPGLARTDDRTFVTAMRAINVAILNGRFALITLGALVTTPAALALHLAPASPTWRWIAAAAVLQLAAVAVTARGNLPLNDALAAGIPTESMSRYNVTRTAFEASWNRWHHLRTLASVAAFACLLAAITVPRY